MNLQNALRDICYENVDCILKLLDENSDKNDSMMLKKTERSFRGSKTLSKDIANEDFIIIYSK